jgi:hypothetical protein
MHWEYEQAVNCLLPIVTLMRGWAFGANNTRYAEHVRCFEDLAEASAAILAAKPCACFDCASPTETLKTTPVTL